MSAVIGGAGAPLASDSSHFFLAIAAPIFVAPGFGQTGNVILAPATGPSSVNAGIESASATTMGRVGAFSLTSGSADAALVATLPPGAYTVGIRGAGTSTGIGMVEIYEVR